MIRVDKYDPPAHYAEMVKQPGQLFLESTMAPTKQEWNKHKYWRHIHDDLYFLYNGICSYCATWTPRGKGEGDSNRMTSVDHFIPKSIQPIQAYEWENFRLCRARLNHNKGSKVGLIDPMNISGDWFVIDFYTFLIQSNNSLHIELKSQVNYTVRVLGLNHDDFVNQRVDIIKNFVLGIVTFSDLQEIYPFIAYEMSRQNFDELHKENMINYFSD